MRAFSLALAGLVSYLSALEASSQDFDAQPSEVQQLIGRNAIGGMKAPPVFLRYVNQAGVPKSLEVAVTHYESPSPTGAEVDLVGAVHIGEAAYYRQLNELFEKYDVVLYELVAAEGTTLPKGGKREGPQHPLAVLQDSAQNMLGLQSQLERVDYTKPNFVRADLTPAQMTAKMEARGDTPLTIALSTLSDILRQQNLAAQRLHSQSAKQSLDTSERDAQQGDVSSAAAVSLLSADVDLLELLKDPLKLKQLLASQIATTGSLDQALGASLNQLLVVDRNEAAAKVLQQQLASGKKRVAIFYGAAHMPDFHQRLVTEFGMHPTSVRWLTAWDLTKNNASPLDNPVSLLLRLLE